MSVCWVRRLTKQRVHDRRLRRVAVVCCPPYRCRRKHSVCCRSSMECAPNTAHRTSDTLAMCCCLTGVCVIAPCVVDQGLTSAPLAIIVVVTSLLTTISS